jgi:phage terminase large subunit-like protein
MTNKADVLMMTEKEWRTRMDNLIMMADQIKQEVEGDPLLAVKLHEKQKVFVDQVFHGKETENWLFTSNRWGKSLVGAYCGSTMARFGNPDNGEPTGGWVVSVDSNASRDIIEPMYFDNGHVVAGGMKPFIPDSEILEWRIKDKVLKLKNGSIIGFKSCESRGRKFPGVARDWIHFDEPPDKFVYDESGIRVGAGKKLRIFGTCTLLPPEGTVGGISWLYNEIVKRENDLPHVKVFTGSIYDNPYLGKEEVAILERRYPVDTNIGKIRILGQLLPGIGGSRVYSPFDRSLHVNRGMTFYTKMPLAWIWDFNVEPMVTYVGQKHGDAFKVFQEFIIDEGNIFSMVDLFRRSYPTHGAEIYIYGDATGSFRDVQTNSSNFNLIVRAMSNYPVPVKLKLPVKNPNVQDRINAVNTALKDEIGAINLHVAPECPELIQDFEEVLSDHSGGIKKTKNPRDPYYKRTHMTDAVGYWVTYEAPAKSTSYYHTRSRLVVPGVPRYAFN